MPDNSFKDNANAAVNMTGHVIEGVGSGILLIAVPLLSLGMAVALGLLLVRAPIKVMTKQGLI